MKKHVVVTIILLCCGIMFIFCASCIATKNVYVDEENSYFSSFKVENGKVFLQCYVTLVNKYDVQKEISLSARLPEDVTIGLLKEEEIKALDPDGLEEVFILPANASKSFSITFVGEYAGVFAKHDRNLPKINVKIVK